VFTSLLHCVLIISTWLTVDTHESLNVGKIIIKEKFTNIPDMTMQLNTLMPISTELVHELRLHACWALQVTLSPVFSSHQNILLAQLDSIHQGFGNTKSYCIIFW